MFEPFDILRNYLQGIRSFSGAVSASLFVPATQNRTALPCLVHSGDHRVLPELETVEAAQNWAARAGAWLEETEPPGSDSMPLLFASGIAEGALFALPDLGSLSALARWSTEDQTTATEGEENAQPNRLAPDALTAEHVLTGAWLGLRFAPGTGSARENLLNKNRQIRRIEEGSQSERWRWLFAMGGALASHSARFASALTDPMSGLLNRAGLQALLGETLEQTRRNRRSLSLLFVNPDKFASVNENSGGSVGERCIREIAVRLTDSLQPGHIPSRFGGAIFAIMLPDTSEEQAHTIGKTTRDLLSAEPYLAGDLNLNFSCGIASWNSSKEAALEPFELLGRANQSLHSAKEIGGGGIAVWSPDQTGGEPRHFDRLTGIFTGNLVQDYRNMSLLWKTIEAVSAGLPFEKLAVQVVAQIYKSFRSRRVVLFRTATENRFELVAERRQQHCSALDILGHPVLHDLLRRAKGDGRPKTLEAADNAGHYAAAVQLRDQDDRVLGCLLIEAREASELGPEDLMFLRALGNQLGAALDRALANQHKEREEARQRRRLEMELDGLRKVVQRSGLIFRSPQMQELVDTARRVAPVDATVLITGSSGTGKELLAQTIHDLSPRRQKAMVVVDCAAISTTLIESELFGHESGSYTGARGRRQGRLSDADGGTLFLDEIGELPLEVQSKLLRFVQERQFTPVGGSRTKEVDVRIIAATNRNLEQEVEDGRFRTDLFHRLNVVRLHITDLKDRLEDVQHLADEFLQHFADQHDRPTLGFETEARTALQAHNWPGNVRELKNRILQASILSDHQYLSAADLGLDPSTSHPGALVPGLGAGAFRPELPLQSRDGYTASPSHQVLPRIRRNSAILERLGASLANQVLECKAGKERPLGQWLYEDLLLEAKVVTNGIARQAAQLIGLPETTFRRRIKALKNNERTASWEEVRGLLAEAVRDKECRDSHLVDRVEGILLSQIVQQHPRSPTRGAALLGVSIATFRNRLARHGVSQPSGSA